LFQTRVRKERGSWTWMGFSPQFHFHQDKDQLRMSKPFFYFLVKLPERLKRRE
jgi:hypothetical protein